MSRAQEILDAVWQPSSEPIVGETYMADGWVYRDLPNLLPELFDRFVSLAGDGNLVWLTLAERKWPDGVTTKRGQCLISPAGVANLTAHVAEEKSP